VDAVSRAIIVAVLAVALATAAVAQERTSSQPPLFRSGTSLVALNVTVTDRDSQFVRGLSGEDFIVFEDGVQQDVRFFEALDVPKDLIILIDTSSSMRHQMGAVHEAAIGFLRTLRPGDRGAVVTFANSVDVVHGLSEDRASLEAAVRGAEAYGATALYNALYIALREFGQGAQIDGDIRRQAIVVLTDGEDTSSLIGFDDVLTVARKSGVSVYPIALQEHSPFEEAGPRRHFTGTDFSLRQLARETGAQSFFPEDVRELSGVYDMIAQELSSQYSIAYASANTRSDGGFRRIQVRVADRPELRLRTRTGYTAELGTASAARWLSGGER
jgi:Ca-activated chloride channel homolog